MYIYLLLVMVSVALTLKLRDTLPKWVAWTVLFIDAFIVGILIGIIL